MLFKELNLHGCVIYLAKILLVVLWVSATQGCGQSGDLSLPKAAVVRVHR
jgi:hypothetical protein